MVKTDSNHTEIQNDFLTGPIDSLEESTMPNFSDFQIWAQNFNWNLPILIPSFSFSIFWFSRYYSEITYIPSQGKGILLHMENCTIYFNKFENFVRDNGNPSPHSRAHTKLRLEFLASHFPILEKNLANWKDRMAAEAFYIRAQRPLLNGQKYHERLSLF